MTALTDHIARISTTELKLYLALLSDRARTYAGMPTARTSSTAVQHADARLPFEDRPNHEPNSAVTIEGALFKLSPETATEFQLGSNCGLRERPGASVTASTEHKYNKTVYVYHFATFLLKRFLQKFVWRSFCHFYFPVDSF